MTVKELIEALQKLPQDHQVLIASDAEGNDINNFEDLSVGYFGKPGEINPWDNGYVDEADWNPENDYEGAYPGDNAVVLWP